VRDDLFSPTIRDRPVPGRPPWRPESILYPAFFGGPLAAATLGVLNGRRLALPSGQLLTIAALGVACFGARFAVSAAVAGNTGVRVAGSVAGALVWAAVVAWQSKPFRAQVLRGVVPASLVGPGFAAVLGCGLIEAVLIAGLTR